MSNRRRTSRFIDLAPYFALGSTVLVLAALVAAQFFAKTLVQRTVNVRPDESVQIENIQLQPRLIGALRIDLKALLPRNQWVVYEIRLLDQQGQIIASGVKEAWKESGTWYEDGATGTWNEENLLGGLDVRAQKNEQVAIAIAVLESGNTSGQTLNNPVPFRVTIENGVVDSRYLWAGLVGTTALSIITFIAVPYRGNRAIAKTINDSDPKARATVGGSNQLVRVKIGFQADETAPPQLKVNLTINNSYGEQIYAQTFPVRPNSNRGKLDQFFIIEPRGSYGFAVEIVPDQPIDQTSLTVLDGSRTLGSVEIVKLKGDN